MSDVTIYNTVSGNKVATQNAAQFASLRIFDQNDGLLCPVRANVSDFGVLDVSRNTLNTVTAGCYDPMVRMTVENSLRPQYSVYLNADAISQVEGDDYANGNFSLSANPSTSDQVLYDTLLGGSTIRPIADNNQMNFQTSLSKLQASAQTPEDKDLIKMRCIMNKNSNCNIYA